MARLRVKNIAAGFYDSHGIFHPIRRSPDYDPDRASDDYGSRTDSAGLRYARGHKPKPRKKAKAKGRKRTAKRTTKRHTKAKGRKRNPIPTSWTSGKVRRLPNGDLQVMIPTRSRSRRRSRKR